MTPLFLQYLFININLYFFVIYIYHTVIHHFSLSKFRYIKMNLLGDGEDGDDDKVTKAVMKKEFVDPK